MAKKTTKAPANGVDRTTKAAGGGPAGNTAPAAGAGADAAVPAARDAGASRRAGAGAAGRAGSAGRSTRASAAAKAAGTGAGPRSGTAVADRPATASPPVPPGSDWTASELAEVRGDLQRLLGDLRVQYEQAIADLDVLQRSANDGAGDDQADAGTKTFEREQELSIANNRLDLLTQMERAIERVDAGTYGHCESCGNPIPKARLQAFPSATLCVACKQREERR